MFVRSTLMTVLVVALSTIPAYAQDTDSSTASLESRPSTAAEVTRSMDLFAELQDNRDRTVQSTNSAGETLVLAEVSRRKIDVYYQGDRILQPAHLAYCTTNAAPSCGPNIDSYTFHNDEQAYVCVDGTCFCFGDASCNDMFLYGGCGDVAECVIDSDTNEGNCACIQD